MTKTEAQALVTEARNRLAAGWQGWLSPLDLDRYVQLVMRKPATTVDTLACMLSTQVELNKIDFFNGRGQ